MIKRVLILLSVVFLSSCSASLEDYRQTQPKFNLFEYFAGNIKAWGMVQDYTGKQTRRFEVDIVGTVEGNTLVLDEQFLFADGEKQTRIWTIERLPDGTYQGTAEDVVGIAKGREEGNALNWIYTLNVAVGDDNYDLKLDDWLFRQDERRAFNLTSMSKFGIEVGRISIFFEKYP